MKCVNFNKARNSKQKGLGMVEIMIGLAIFVTFVATILTLGRSLLGQTDVTTAAMDHTSLVNGVRNMYRLDNDYVGLSNDTLLVNGQAVPESMRGADPATDIRHEWSIDGTEVTVTPVDANQKFTVTYTSIPQEFCVGFASSIYRDALESTVGGTAVTSATDIAGECDVADDAVLTMVFTYN